MVSFKIGEINDTANECIHMFQVVPDILAEDDDQVSRDLKLLALQQDKLIAELLKAYKDEEGDDPEGKKRRLDEEMEARIRALNNSRAVSRAMLAEQWIRSVKIQRQGRCANLCLCRWSCLVCDTLVW